MTSDEQLMAAYVDGDSGAFGELFERYAPMLHRMVGRRIRQPEDVSELVQQTFLQVHRARRDFDRGRSVRPWLVTIALNLEREYFRRRGRRPEATLEEEPAAPAYDADGRASKSNGHAAHGLDRARQARRLRQALARLPAGQREIIEMHWFEGLGFAEIAHAMGLGLSAVKVRAHRGYRALRLDLESDPRSGRAESTEDAVTVGPSSA